MGLLKLIDLGLKRFRSTDDYRVLQQYLANATVAELERRGIRFAQCDVLELAAGRGGYSSVLCERAKSFLANDLHPDPYFEKNGIPFRDFDACEHFPLDSESFDLVYSSSLIEHLARPERMLAQCRRVLRPHGIFFLSFPPFYSIAMVGGHKFKPFHFLGERTCLLVHNRLRHDNVASYATCYGAFGLYPLTITRVSKMIGNAGFQLLDVYTRMMPINTCRLPGIFKDLATWHACFIARPD